jgi:hypothetical protein
MITEIKVGVAVPWRPDPSRITAFRAFLNFYQNYFPEFNFYFADSDTKQWSNGQASNKATEMAIADECDVIISADADSIPNKKALIKAIEKSYKENIITQPFSRRFELNYDTTQLYLRRAISKKEIRAKADFSHFHPGVLQVLTPKVFKELNGWDERFFGCSGDDVAFEFAHKAIYGVEYFRIDSEIYSLWHDNRDKSTWDNNQKRLEEVYMAPDMTAEKMREIISGNRLDSKQIKL